MKNVWIAALLVLGAVLFARPGFAQEEAPKGPNLGWDAQAALNALIATGNSESINVGGNSEVSRRWQKDKFTHTAKGAYGRSEDPNTGVTSTNTKNWRTSLRYDRYLTDPISIFENAFIGQDQPAGFDWRYGGGAGLAHELVQGDPNFFKYEAGFDYTRELKVGAPDDHVYSARIFLQYKRKISDWASLGQDVENLINVETAEDYRLNSLTSISMKLSEKLSLQVGYEVRFDNQPVAGAEKVDTETKLGLVIDFI